MKRLILFLTLLSLSSCDIMKKSQKTKNDIATVEESEVKTVRIGDTVYFKVPKATYKDTTIYTFNRQGTTLKTVYDNSGQVTDIECQTSAIELYEKMRKSIQDNTVVKEKEKTEEVNFDWLIYIVIGLVVVVMFALLLGFFYIRKNTAIVNQIADKL